MREIAKTLNSMWLDTDGNTLKTPLKIAETKGNFSKIWII